MKIMLDENAIAPTRAHEIDAGLDLYAKEWRYVPANGSEVFRTGVHVQIPHGYCGLLVSRSGLNVKYDITSTGLIDEGYTGEIVVKLYNDGLTDYYVAKGDRITQLVLLPVLYEPVEVVESFESSDRGSNGFGSSGK